MLALLAGERHHVRMNALLGALGVLLLPAVGAWPARTGAAVRGNSKRALHLKAFLWTPPGRGPFPAVLFNQDEGHNLLYQAVPLWEPDVFAFLNRCVRR